MTSRQRICASALILALCITAPFIIPIREQSAPHRNAPIKGVFWQRSRVLVTAYVVGTDSRCYTFHDATASGTIATIGTAAVDPRVFPFGTRFRIPGYGYAIARDTGSYIQGHHIDVVFHSCRRAVQWGAQRLVVSYLNTSHQLAKGYR